ncbi:MAG TPA: mersacidin/lichenicidin family type 2 lantibiotic [Enhygromyxa sp.]|nr:mersacidin/lichenicidin family type 2 lantibiotic [Enhygromyxa sp.]
MSNIDIIRAWKDPSYYQSLSADERALVPDNPAGPVEVDDAELTRAVGKGPAMAEFTYNPNMTYCCTTKSICTLCLLCDL